MAIYQMFFDIFGVILLLGLLFFFLMVWYIRNDSISFYLPPGPKTWPVVGCIPELLYTIITTKPRSLLELLNYLYDIYGSVCYLSLPFGIRIVLVSGYQAVYRSVLTIIERPPIVPRQTEELMNSGIVMSFSEVWNSEKQQRRFPLALHQAAVHRCLGVGKIIFEDQIATESQYLTKEMSSMEGNPFNPAYILTKSISNVTCSVVFGKRFEYDDKEFNRLLHLLEESCSNWWFTMLFLTFPKLLRCLVKIPYFPNKEWLSIVELRQYLKDIIDEHRETLDPYNTRDFIDAYLTEKWLKESKERETCLNNTEILDVVHELFLAGPGLGTETTSSILSWALLYMIEYPEIQKRVHEEIDAAVGPDRLPRLADKSNLPYTQAVIYEIQRFSCVATITGARYVDRSTEIEKCSVPKDAYIIANLVSVMRDPAIWEKPGDFRPERFLDDKGQVANIQKLIVYSGGKRVCLGEHLARMQIFIFYTHLMHQFRFEKSTEEALKLDRTGGAVNRPFPYKIRVINRV